MIDKERDMKKVYKNPQLTFTELNVTDIVTTSDTYQIGLLEEGDGFLDGETW